MTFSVLLKDTLKPPKMLASHVGRFLIEYQYLCRLGGDGRLEGGGDWLETKHFAAGFFLGQSHLLGDGGQYLASTLTHCRSAQCDFY